MGTITCACVRLCWMINHPSQYEWVGGNVAVTFINILYADKSWWYHGNPSSQGTNWLWVVSEILQHGSKCLLCQTVVKIYTSYLVSRICSSLRDQRGLKYSRQNFPWVSILWCPRVIQLRDLKDDGTSNNQWFDYINMETTHAYNILHYIIIYLKHIHHDKSYLTRTYHNQIPWILSISQNLCIPFCKLTIDF